MKNYDIAKGQCALNTNFLGLNKGSTAYMIHGLAGVLVILLSIHPLTRGFSWQSVTLVTLAITVFLQLGFWRVNKDAQKCAQPKDKSVVWTDNTLFWYKDPFFLTLCAGALVYGLCLFMPGNIACFDLQKVLPSSDLGKTVTRVLTAFPTVGFIYYFIWTVILKNQLVKPVRSTMYWWERPLAVIFSLVFLPLLLFTILGDRLVTGKGVYKIVRGFFSFRLWPAIVLAAVLYVFVWRLQGGLFASKKQYDKLEQKWGRKQQ